VPADSLVVAVHRSASHSFGKGVKPQDRIRVELPAGPHSPLLPV